VTANSALTGIKMTLESIIFPITSLLILAKIAGMITWPWLLVFSPIWATFLVVFVDTYIRIRRKYK